MRFYFITPALLMAIAVGLGAIGSHALKGSLSIEQIKIFNLAVTYQFYHCFALFLSAWRIEKTKCIWHKVSYYLFLNGLILFSGSLYFITVFNLSSLRKFTPLGGSLLIFAWIIMAIGYIKEDRK